VHAVTVDDSPTAVRVWPRLVERLPLTVVTDSLPAIDELAADPRVRLQAIGGDQLADVHPSGGTVDLERACMARLGALLSDHTDTTSRAVHRSGVLPHFEAVVVDDRVDAGEIKRLCARGADVVVAPTPGGPRASQPPPAGENAEAQDGADTDAPEPER
jgi:DeoR/GlpR family transcriptional regulator of sugar metabolism